MIALTDVSVVANGRAIVRAVHLRIARGERVALLGPSGAGKSTCLRLINGLMQPTRGEVSVDGKPLASQDVVALRRRIGWVIQDAGLFPHLDVAQNIGFVPRLLGWEPDRIRKRVDQTLQLVGLDPERFRSAMPRALSGGERQRVGVARAIAAEPPIVLLDEPFAALDPLLRAELQRDVAAVLAETTMVIVTHDVVEALTMAERIVLLEDGAVVVDVPRAQLLSDQHPLARAYARTAIATREALDLALR
jgi:osmoprotectant transport system ATP-binding protein